MQGDSNCPPYSRVICYEYGYGGAISIVTVDRFSADGVEYEVSISKGTEYMDSASPGRAVGRGGDKTTSTTTTSRGPRTDASGRFRCPRFVGITGVPVGVESFDMVGVGALSR